MIDSKSYARLKEAIADCIDADREVLDALREEIRPLKKDTLRIQPRTTTSISLVGTDGGNNQLQFDPFFVQLIRVVDSSNNEYCLDTISPTTSLDALSKRQFGADGNTALGKMMDFLGVKNLSELSHRIVAPRKGATASPGWVQTYRELVEWAVLFAILEKDFAADTLIVYDGLFRSVVFADDLFQRLMQGMNDRIREHKNNSGRQIYLAGVAKRSKILVRYRLALALENVLQTDYPAYVEVPSEIEEKTYRWPEYTRGDGHKFVNGRMFLVRFGAHRHDPIWPVDIFESQADQSHIIIGAMLADAVNGFPVPYYPRCLQKAHENAALVDFDFQIMQDAIYESVRENIGTGAEILDAFRIQDADPAQRRYG